MPIAAGMAIAAPPQPGMASPLPDNVHLQSVRATSAANDEVLVRLQHLYTAGEDASMSAPQRVDPLALLARSMSAATEVTLDGMRDISSTANRTRYPAEASFELLAPTTIAPAVDSNVTVGPFELRTFRLSTSTLRLIQ